MAETAQNVGIKQSWSLMAFRNKFEKMEVGKFKNSETGDVFNSCIFTDADGDLTFVSFSSKLGELTPSQIASQKNTLQVVELESGTFKLCKQGENNWQEVVL